MGEACRLWKHIASAPNLVLSFTLSLRFFCPYKGELMAPTLLGCGGSSECPYASSAYSSSWHTVMSSSHWWWWRLDGVTLSLLLCKTSVRVERSALEAYPAGIKALKPLWVWGPLVEMGSWCREQIGDEFRGGGGHILLPLAFSLPRRGPSQLLGVYPTAKAHQAPSADSCPGRPTARGWAMLSCRWACTLLPALLRWYVLPLIFLRDFSLSMIAHGRQHEIRVLAPFALCSCDGCLR